MRIAILSDIHSNPEALQAVLDDLRTRNIARILCLGDVVGYNTGPTECIQLLREHDALCVAGNHDRAATQQISTKGFSYTAAIAVSWTRRHLDAGALAYLSNLPTELSIPDVLVAVHGALHPKNAREMVRLDNDEQRRLSFDALATHPSRARICAFGHTHQLGIYELHGGVVQKLEGDRVLLHRDGWYLVNPGTVGQPSAIDLRATYLIFDSARNEITTHWVAYDTTIPFTKTRRAGLAPIWAGLPPPIGSTIRRLPRPVRKAIKWGMEALRL